MRRWRGAKAWDTRFRYTHQACGGVKATNPTAIRPRSFELAATPVEYGNAGRRSFYLDSKGVLRGADKHGAVATIDDPEIGEPRP